MSESPRARIRRSVSPSSTIGELRRRNPARQGSVAVRTERRAAMFGASFVADPSLVSVRPLPGLAICGSADPSVCARRPAGCRRRAAFRRRSQRRVIVRAFCSERRRTSLDIADSPDASCDTGHVSDQILGWGMTPEHRTNDARSPHVGVDEESHAARLSGSARSWTAAEGSSGHQGDGVRFEVGGGLASLLLARTARREAVGERGHGAGALPRRRPSWTAAWGARCAGGGRGVRPVSPPRVRTETSGCVSAWSARASRGGRPTQARAARCRTGRRTTRSPT